MSRLIFISGASGAGKSHTVAALPENVLCIGVDRLQYDLVRRAFPFVRLGREYDWFLWPRDASTLDLVRLFEIGLAGLWPQLVGHRGHLVVEGAILVNEWFRITLQHTLLRFGHRFADADVHCLFLDLPAPVLLERIHRRARERPELQSETVRYPDVASVERLRMLHVAQLLPGRWESFGDNAALSARLEQLLG